MTSIRDLINLVETAEQTGHLIDAYHGRVGDFTKFSHQKKSHLGFHFGSTPTAANDKLTNDQHYDSDRMRRGGTLVALYGEEDRNRARTRIQAEIARIEQQVNAIRAAIQGRAAPVDHDALLAALERNDDAEITRLLDTGSPSPTPEEDAEIKRLFDQIRRLNADLAVFFQSVRSEENIIPVKLKLINPIRMNDTNWGEPERIRQDNRHLKLRGDTLADIRDELERRGHDGIVYRNEVEGIDEDSYIVFHPEQVRSRFARFDPGMADSPNLLDSITAPRTPGRSTLVETANPEPTPVEAFEDAFYARYEALPFHAVTDISLHQQGDATVYINHIGVDRDHRGSGHGSALLGLLCEVADEFGITLTLSPAEDADGEDGGMDMLALMEWYERYGFEGGRAMVRYPAGDYDE